MKTSTQDETEVLQDLIVPKGTRITIEGIPFWLPQDTVVQGLAVNLELVKKWSDEAKIPSIPDPRYPNN